jgi:hypothetical protein
MRVREWWWSGQDPWVKFVELFLAANAIAAVISLTLAPGSEDWFTWTVVPDAGARLLAVMYANALVLSIVALRQPDWAHARVIVVLITVFAVAATVMTFFNLTPFRAHPWYHLAYWLTGYAVLVATAPIVLFWQERVNGGRLPVEVPLSTVQRLTGAVAGIAMAVASLALLIDPVGFSDIWPWDVAPLTGRLVGVWLGAFATAYFWALWDGDWRRVRPLYLAAPITGALLALVPIVGSGDVRPSATGELFVYYWLTLAVAAPGLGLLERSRERSPQRPAPEAEPATADGVKPMMPGVRAGLVAIASVIFWLGLSLFVFSTHTDDLFAWTIDPPLTAAFLGASYWASTTLAAACASEREWARGRAFAAPYFIAGVVLLWVTFLYWDRFHMDEVTGWLWLALYAVFPPSVLLLLGRQVRTPGAEPPRGPRISNLLLGLIGLQGAVMVVIGTALIVAPEDASSLWPWQLTPLTGRAIGTFVLAQGVLSFTVCRERDWSRVRPAMLQNLVIGTLDLVAVARFSDTFDWDAAGAWLYVAFVVSLLGIGLYGTLRAATTHPRTRAPANIPAAVR